MVVVVVVDVVVELVVLLVVVDVLVLEVVVVLLVDVVLVELVLVVDVLVVDVEVVVVVSTLPAFVPMFLASTVSVRHTLPVSFLFPCGPDSILFQMGAIVFGCYLQF